MSHATGIEAERAPVPAAGPHGGLRVIIADDHHLVRDGLKELIASQRDMRVAAECRTGREVLEALGSGPCDVLLLDIFLPDMSGLDVLNEIRTSHPDVCVLVLSGYPERQFGLNVLRSGGRGFVSKGVDQAELLRAIRSVSRGHRYVGPELADQLVSGARADPNEPQHNRLSRREFQIFCKLAEGVPASSIAEALGISVKTVSTYRSRLLSKMGMSTNADITYYALKNGLLR